MRTITKVPEPHSLAQHRARAHADYDNYEDKDNLRAQLVNEQRVCVAFAVVVYWLRRRLERA
jgi:hypothetical protein